MSSPECSCRPHTAALQAKHDAFVRRYQDDDDALLESISEAHPDGATSAHLCDLETAQRGKPHAVAGQMRDLLDFDRMVRLARFLLFDKSMRDGSALNSMNRPRLDRLPKDGMVLVKSYAELLFESYRDGGCLRCTSLIKDAGRDGEPGREGERILRSLLGVFDQEGERIPRELRAWSAESRLEKPPPGGQGSPKRYGLRDRRIIHTVAYLAYLTDRDPTRKDKSEAKSVCDAVALALQKNGFSVFTYQAAKTVWRKTKKDGVALGPVMLERWKEQDRKALAAQERAQRRSARLAYWHKQGWWHEA